MSRRDSRPDQIGLLRFARLGRLFDGPAGQLQPRRFELEAERARARAAVRHIGEALAATHDSGRLQRVIVETAVEATRAAGGKLVGPDSRLVVGDLREHRDRIEQPLVAGSAFFGTLVLVGAGFDEEARELATQLANQGAMALENARLHEIAKVEASRDELTGLSNRRRAQRVLSGELRRAERLASALALALADLDDFKAVNDEHGHVVGDLVLREFAAAALATVRDIDHVARWGGEEFAIFLPGADVQAATIVAERIRRSFESRTIAVNDGQPLAVTASFGVAAYPDEPGEEQLITAADAALYAAKRSGKNRVLASGEFGHIRPAGAGNSLTRRKAVHP
jgi:diguanylate cyclase (GGDEF)-like protein